MRSIIALLLALVMWAAPVRAADTPEAPPVAAAPAWVEPQAIPAPDPTLGERPIQLLLVNAQSRYGKDGSRDYYVEYATRVQTPQGLAVLGNITLPWQPGMSELIVHKVHILRDGKVIDLLAGGSGFTVLRREGNLESAVLDGTLTAVLQPEGLSVGDIVNVAWTMRVKPLAFAPAPENLLTLVPGFPVRHLRYRETWDESLPVRWRASPGLGKPRLRKAGGFSELVVDLEKAESPAPPQGAPARYQFPPALEISGYKSWSDLSRLMTPLYSSARTLAPDSALKPEIERIAAASADPGTRAMAALRLVQDKIRYFALAMGEGGYAPATADQTWKRRFGDCKGKTVTLLALLSGLGIEAEPVLVSSVFADSLGERLPMMRLFDHVIVRARIGGRSYWLDGTRTGDRNLDDLLSSPFHYGLPLSASGAEMEALPLEPPSLPISDVEISYDASGGIAQPVPVTVEMIFRGDLATVWRAGLAEQGEAALRDSIRDQVPAVPSRDLELKSVRNDDSTGEMHFSLVGRTTMRWDPAPTSRKLRFRFDQGTVEWKPSFERTAAAGSDAPFALSFPVFQRVRETIVLPKGGAGFSIEGNPLDATVAATRITRSVALEGGKAVALSTFRRLRDEIPAAEAKTAVDATAELNQSFAYVVAPADYRMSEKELSAVRAVTPLNAGGYLDRGYKLMNEGSLNAALADFGKALELDPTNATAYADRGVAFIHLGKLDEAEAALRRASELDDRNFIVHQGLGMLLLEREKPAEAAAAFSRSLELSPDNVATLGHRASAYEQLGKLREALADMERIAAVKPEASDALWEIARLRAALGDRDEALAAIDRRIALDPKSPAYVGQKGEVLSRFGRGEEAMAAWRKALALIDEGLKAPDAEESDLLLQRISILELTGDYKAAIAVADARLRRYAGSVTFLAARCEARAAGAIELPLAQKDCDEAVRADAGDDSALRARTLLALRRQQWASAIADSSALLANSRHDYRALYLRGLARLRKGDREAGERDLAEARRLSFDVDSEFASLGLKP
jgi:tetratricopeptide (TPR) repeat protein